MWGGDHTSSDNMRRSASCRRHLIWLIAFVSAESNSTTPTRPMTTPNILICLVSILESPFLKWFYVCLCSCSNRLFQIWLLVTILRKCIFASREATFELLEWKKTLRTHINNWMPWIATQLFIKKRTKKPLDMYCYNCRSFFVGLQHEEV